MKASLPLIALVALNLAACSKKADDPAPTATTPTATTPAAPSTPEPTVTAEPVEPETAPVATPSPTPTATAVPGEIPSALLGRWGLVPRDCTSTLGDAKGLLIVSAKQLKFYEALARLGAVKNVTDDSIRATFAFSGEGQAWTLDVALAVRDGGKTLIRRDTGKDAAPGPLKYTRCS